MRGESNTLEQELNAATKHISKLTAGSDSSNIWDNSKLQTWIKPKNSKSRCCRFSADDAPQVQLNKQIQHTGNKHNGCLLAKHECRKVKSFAGSQKVKKRTHCWEAVKGGTSEPCSKKTWAVSLIPLVFLSQMFLLQRLQKLCYGLTKQDHFSGMARLTAWTEITITQQKRMSTSLQRGQPTQTGDLATSSRAMTSQG
jgi:hypothetical protein